MNDDSSTKINIKRIANRNILNIMTGYNLELLTPETIKLPGSNETKITEDKNSENLPHLEITKTTLVHCNIVNIAFNKS